MEKRNYVSSLLMAGACSLMSMGCASMPTPLKVVVTPIAVVRDVGDLILSPIAYGTERTADYLDFDGKIAKLRAEQAELEKEIENDRIQSKRLENQFNSRTSNTRATNGRVDYLNTSNDDFENRFNRKKDVFESPISSSSYPSQQTYSPSYSSGVTLRGEASAAPLIAGVAGIISGVVGGIDYVAFRSFCGGLKGKSPWKKPTSTGDNGPGSIFYLPPEKTESWGNFLFPNTRELWGKKEEK